MNRSSLLAHVLLLTGVAATSGCGAGLGVTAWFSRNNSSNAPAAAAQLSVSQDNAPLKLPPGELLLRTLTVSNYQIGSTATLRLEMRARGVVQEQRNLALVSVTGRSSTLLFVVETSAISQALSGQGDVDTTLHLFVNGREVAGAIPFKLLRQPQIEFDQVNKDAPVFVSVDGTTRVNLRVRFLRARDVKDAWVEFLLRQPEQPATSPQGVRVQRAASADFDFDNGLISAVCPAHPHVGIAGIQVRDSQAGTSVPLVIYYVPSVQYPVPSTAKVDGDEFVSIAGTGLVPLEYTNGRTEPQWDKMTLTVSKGAVERALEADRIDRANSNPNILRFRIPPSPDGEPGPATIVHRVEYVGTAYETRVGGDPADPRTLRYGRSVVLFGRRFTVVDDEARAFARGVFRPQAPRGDLDLAIMTTPVLTPRVRLCVGTGSGLFIRRGSEVLAGDPLVATQVRGSMVLSARLRAADPLGLFVVNTGTGSAARNSPLLSRLPLENPFRLLVPDRTLDGATDATSAVAGDLDGDGLDELLVLDRPSGLEALPAVYSPRAPITPGGDPRFLVSRIDHAGAMPGRALAVADLDGDGRLDVAFASGVSPLNLTIMFGDGTGGFRDVQVLPCEVPGFAAVGDVGARALVPLRAGLATPVTQHLAVVLGGIANSATSPPSVVLVTFDRGSQRFNAPTGADLVSFPTADAPFVCATAGDIDGDGRDDLFVGAGGPTTDALQVMVQAAGRLVPAPAGTVPPDQGLGDGIKQLEFVQLSATPPVRKALLGLHVFSPVGAPPNVVSTWLVENNKLKSTDASTWIPNVPRSVVAGRFDASATVPDLVVAHDNGLSLLANDGVGNFSTTTAIEPAMPPIIANTLVRVSRRSDDLAVFVLRDGRLGVHGGGHPAPVIGTSDLRDLCGAAFAGATLADDCSAVAADVDGDQVTDVVVLLKRVVVPGPRGENDGCLLFLKGIDATTFTAPPFVLPAAGLAAPTHGESVALTLCELMRGDDHAPPTLEAALVVPPVLDRPPSEAGHLRFFRFDPGEAQRSDDGRFVRSYAPGGAQFLLAGPRPAHLAALDMDGDGRPDLAVLGASTTRACTLRFIYNRIPINATDVAIERLIEGAGTPEAPLGEPVALATRDVDGDVFLDLIIHTRLTTPTPQDYLQVRRTLSGGQRSETAFVPQLFAGTGVYGCFEMADLDLDGLPDLMVPRQVAGTAADRNVRVLAGLTY